MRAVGVGRTGYGTSKAAVIGLTRQMAVELAEHGITANAIAPGPVDTPMTRVLHSSEFRQQYTDAIPMNRYGTPEEIAAAVAYLASDGAGVCDRHRHSGGWRFSGFGGALNEPRGPAA